MGADLYLSQGASDHPAHNERDRLVKRVYDLELEVERLRRVLQRIADGYDEWQDDETVNWGTTEISRDEMMLIADGALK